MEKKIVGYELKVPKNISQRKFDNGMARVKEGFRREGIDFDNEDIIVSGHVEKDHNGFYNVLTFIKVV